MSSLNSKITDKYKYYFYKSDGWKESEDSNFFT